MREKEILEKYFAPISKNFSNSFFLEDDAALLKNFNNQDYVVSVDNFIHGVHCPLDLKPKASITRAILTATSDLAAMAAKPYCMFLSISLPNKNCISKMKKISIGIKKKLSLERC